jgi:hypothetical protein
MQMKEAKKIQINHTFLRIFFWHYCSASDPRCLISGNEYSYEIVPLKYYSYIIQACFFLL